MNIPFDRRRFDQPQIEVNPKTAGAPINPFSADRAPCGLAVVASRRPLGITFTATTLLCMLFGWLSTRTLPSTPEVGVAYYLLAYVTDGFFGGEAGRQFLRSAFSSLHTPLSPLRSPPAAGRPALPATAPRRSNFYTSGSMDVDSGASWFANGVPGRCMSYMAAPRGSQFHTAGGGTWSVGTDDPRPP